LTVSYNRKNKERRMKARLSKMTISEYKKLRPDEVIGHRKIVDFMKQHDIRCKVG